MKPPKLTREKLDTDGSYAKANEIYGKIDVSALSSEEARWVEFRMADTEWRSQARTDNADTTKLDAAHGDLEKTNSRSDSGTISTTGCGPRWRNHWAIFGWIRRNNNNMGEAWPHYQAALDWWAGAKDVELARQRYLAIVWRMAKAPGFQNEEFYYSYWGNFVPLDILDNALKIAQMMMIWCSTHYSWR